MKKFLMITSLILMNSSFVFADMDCAKLYKVPSQTFVSYRSLSHAGPNLSLIFDPPDLPYNIMVCEFDACIPRTRYKCDSKEGKIEIYINDSAKPFMTGFYNSDTDSLLMLGKDTDSTMWLHR
jgi:hypothetical protein